jgi:catalase
VHTEQGESIDVEVTLEASPAVLYDGMAVPGGHEAAVALGNLGHAAEFIKDQYRHCKPILALGAGAALVENAGVPMRLDSGEPDPGLLVAGQATIDEVLPEFIQAITRHRHFERHMDPPPV